MTGVTVLLYFLILLFFAFSIFCGVSCVKTLKYALVYSLTNQLLQVLGFAVMGFAFKYSAGVYFTLGLDLSESIRLTFSTGFSNIEFTFNTDKERLEINLNLIAIGLIFWIDHLMKKVKEETAVRKAQGVLFID